VRTNVLRRMKMMKTAVTVLWLIASRGAADSNAPAATGHEIAVSTVKEFFAADRRDLPDRFKTYLDLPQRAPLLNAAEVPDAIKVFGIGRKTRVESRVHPR